MVKRELPKHVYSQRNGIYFQHRGRPSQKFENEFGMPEFLLEYAGILSQRDKPRRVIARNFGALIDSYRKSPRYRNHKPRTGLDYDRHLDWFREIMGDANPAKMQRKDVIRLRDANAEKTTFPTTRCAFFACSWNTASIWAGESPIQYVVFQRSKR